MTAEIAISVRGVSKTYAIFARPKDRLKQMFWRRRRKFFREFRALSDVSFDVYRGETVGIVGRNGSGKSTLLQIIAGTLTPTKGEAVVNGRVAALLELGAGFNPDFTGRENVFLNAAVLGMGRQEIEQRFDAIAAFAEVGKFIDQPLKRYSSGMKARLAFAVAISVDPDILVVDETLSVGDEAFRRKCFARIDEIKRGGATILFVSHSAGNVIDLCDRAILIDGGERLLTGAPKQVIAQYQRLIYAPSDKTAEIRREIQEIDKGGASEADTVVRSAQSPDAAATGVEEARPVGERKARFDPNLKPKSTVEYVSRGARIHDVRILDEDGRRVNVLIPRETYRYAYEVTFDRPAEQVNFGMLIKTLNGIELGGMAAFPRFGELPSYAGGQKVSVEFRFRALLAAKSYFTNAGVLGNIDGEATYLHRIIDAAMFRIEPDRGRIATGSVDFCATSTRAYDVTLLDSHVLDD